MAPSGVLRGNFVAMLRILPLALVVALGGCFVPIHRTHTAPLSVAPESLARDSTIAGELRVRRLDGRDVTFAGPTLLGPDGVFGRGRVSGARGWIEGVPRDSIVSILRVRREVRPVPTALATAAATFATTAAIFVAFFSIWT